jgi:hypothetical protein
VNLPFSLPAISFLLVNYIIPTIHTKGYYLLSLSLFLSFSASQIYNLSLSRSPPLQFIIYSLFSIIIKKGSDMYFLFENILK